MNTAGAVVGLLLAVLLAGCTASGPGSEDARPDDAPPPAEVEPSDGDEDDATPGASPPEADDREDGPDGGRAVEVEVHFDAPGGEPGDTEPVRRTVAAPAVLEGAMLALLEGPTEQEQRAGHMSWFSSETAGLLRGVELDDGVATIDFDARLREVIPNASTSAGSAALLASLDATATQFPTVDAAVYALDGDVEAFYSWLQLVAPEA